MKYLSVLIAIIFSTSTWASTQEIQFTQLQRTLQKLEKNFDGKIGVYAVDTTNNQIIAYRADERFPVQSTFKLIAVSALLKNSDKNTLQQKIHYKKEDLIFWHPVTGNYLNSGMTLKALSEAAMTYSDNTAANLILKKIGGPKLVTDFARSIGNETFNIKHYEPNLNSDPTNEDDTSTPKDMAISLQKLTLGDVLTQSQRRQLISWMRNNVTDYKRIRAGVPIGWAVSDKTGSGDYGIANDIGILSSPVCKPIVLAIYTVRNKQDAKSREDVVATVTSIVMEQFAKNNPCFKKIEI